MQRKLFFVLVLTALLPAVLFAAGKISGKVTDAGTGEPLVGANVVVVGTSMGAATNVAGEFTILNVPAGTYTLRTSYVGYQMITLSNIRVNEGLTSTANFALPAEGVTVGTVEIVAERPLINRSATNAVRIIDNDFFDKIPGRGVAGAIAIQPGVVVQGGVTYIRGGRPDEVGYRIEGVATTDIVNGGNGLYTTAEAVEQIQVQAGGFNAEFGGANAGIIQTQLRTGSPERWKGTLLAETDNYTKQNTEALGGYSYGYSDFTATLGGPLVGKTLRFFGSVQNTFYRDASVAVREPWEFTNLVSDPLLTPAHPTTALSDTIKFLSMGGNAVGGAWNRYAFTGTLLLDMGVWQLRGAGSYSTVEQRTATTFGNLLNQNRLGMYQGQNAFANLKFSWVFSPTTFLEVNGNWYHQTNKNYDPDFGEDLFAYGDSTKNAALGYKMRAQGENYSQYSFYSSGITGLSQPGRSINTYSKNRQTSIGARADFTTQIKSHELKLGGEFNTYEIRRYNPGDNRSWAAYKQTYTNPAELEAVMNKSAGVGSDLLGYDIFGNEVDADVVKDGGIYYFAPRKPVFMALYAQDKIEFSDIILNFGLRWDYIDPNSVDTQTPGALDFNNDGFIMQSSLTETEKTSQVSPRIGFSFPVTDRTVFHAQYGKFIQQSRLNDSYRGASYLAGNSAGGYWVAGPSGWGIRPERTTQYELGFSQVVSDVASFDLTAFYKDIRDQIQFFLVPPEPGSGNKVYSSLGNTDFSTTKGIEVKFILRRTSRVAAQVNYTFSDARGTATNPSSSNGIWQLGLGPDALPRYVFPVDFNQAHRGAVNIDYRWGKDDGGPILSQLGANLLLTFNSGHSYTRFTENSHRDAYPTDQRNRDPIEPVGSSTTPWFFQLDARIDKSVAIGPLDVNFFIYVINILGTDNPVNAFPRTGDTMDPGWFQTPGGIQDVQTLGQGFVDLYTALNNGRNQGNFGPPRQFRFGIRLDI